jgi:hypothetical protein
VERGRKRGAGLIDLAQTHEVRHAANYHEHPCMANQQI